jgi:hypothetical protein
MPWPQNQSLTAADGATFLALIEETPEGLWRASATVRLDKGYEILDQSLGIEMFPTLKDARGWVNRAAANRGFKNPEAKIIPLPTMGI